MALPVEHRQRNSVLAAFTALGLVLQAWLPAAAEALIEGKPIRSWGYQLQNDDADVIARSPYDVMVIDYSKDSSDRGAFKTADLDKMKRKPDGSRRYVLAYISIGEAETYRYYWGERGWPDGRNRKPMVENENPEWLGNHSIKFWHNEWQDLILNDDDSYMNRIARAGFDGVYLDKVDIADFYAGKTPPGTIASDLMIQFVRKISIVMKSRKPGFLIFPQNAQGLLEDDAYRAAIDGIGIEDLLHKDTPVEGPGSTVDGPRNAPGDIKESVDLLKKLVADKKPVIVVEYLRNRASIDRANTELQGYGFVPYFGPRDLARLALP
jgi:cysteinyl-tRNA synthetase, unknown class